VGLGKGFWVGEEISRLRVWLGNGFWVDEVVVWLRVKAGGALEGVFGG
jgi:hypothetical protein